MTEFSLNQNVKVRLTNHGIGILRDAHYDLQEKMCLISYSYEKQPFVLSLDEDGYYKTQMWALMQSFGNYVGIAKEPPFDIKILIE